MDSGECCGQHDQCGYDESDWLLKTILPGYILDNTQLGKVDTGLAALQRPGPLKTRIELIRQ